MSKVLTDQVYRSVLAYAGFKVNDEGEIYSQLSDSQEIFPAKLGDDRLVLPIRHQFDLLDQGNKVYFHPLCESFILGESEVNRFLTKAISIRLNYVTAMVALRLIELAGSKALHKNFSPKQSTALMVLKNADETTVKNWSTMVPSLMKRSPMSAFIKLYLKNTGKYKGETYSRVGIVTFPFYDDIVAERQEFKRNDDLLAIKAVFEMLFPGLNVPETYNYGTRSNVAPYLESLLKSSLNVARRLNTVIEQFSDQFSTDAESLYFDTSWTSSFSDMESLRPEIRKIPDMPGNIGVDTVKNLEHPGQNIQALHKTPAPTIVQQVPTAGGINRAPAQQEYQQVQQPQMQPMQPVYVQPQQAPAGPPTTAEGKISFGSVAVGGGYNPITATMQQQQANEFFRQYGYYPQGYNPMMQPGMPVLHTPGFAMPNVPQAPQMVQYQGQPYPQMVQYPNGQVMVQVQQPQPQYQGQVVYQQPQYQQPGQVIYQQPANAPGYGPPPTGWQQRP